MRHLHMHRQMDIDANYAPFYDNFFLCIKQFTLMNYNMHQVLVLCYNIYDILFQNPAYEIEQYDERVELE